MTKSQSPSSVIRILVIAIIIDTMGFGLIFPILPSLFISRNADLVSIHTGIQVRHLYYAISLALWPVGNFFGTPFFGRLSDKYGRKPILLICLSCLCICYCFYALAVYLHSALLFFIMNLIAGFFGGNYDVAQAAVVDVSPPQQKTRNIGWIAIAAAIGMIVGPVITSFTTDTSIRSWLTLATPFGIAAILTAANVLMILTLFKETYAGNRLLRIGMTKALSACSFIFTDARVSLIGLAYFGLTFGWGLYFVAMPLILAQVFNLHTHYIGLFFCVLGLGNVFAIVFVQPLLTNRYSAQKIYVAAIITIAIGMMICLVVKHWIMLGVMAFILAMLQVLCISNLLSMCSDQGDRDEYGKIMGGLGALASVAMFASSMMLTWIISKHIVLPFIVSGISFLISGGLVMYKRRQLTGARLGP
jgi:MFS family permease